LALGQTILGMNEKQRLAAKKLAEAAEKGVAGWGGELSKIELEIESEKAAMGARLMTNRLGRLPPETGGPKACPWCGRKVRVRRRDVPRTFRTMSGEHTYSRNYHHCEKCGKGFYPMDKFLGLPEHGELSTEVEKRVADFGINDGFEFGAERWNFLFPQMPISSNQVRQTMERLGRSAEESKPTILQGALLAPPETEANVLYVMNDGGMVPMLHGEWNEVKLGVLFRDDNHLSGREAKRGVITRARYVAVLGEQEQFKAELREALDVECASAARRVVWLADGALGNWSLASVLAPRAIQILDFQHAIEHGVGCARILLGEGNPYLPLWQERIDTMLKSGQLRSIVAELIECAALVSNPFEKKAINNLVRYYFHNRHRMKYDRFLRLGFLIGSGVVESAHRHVIQQRMKRAGQHWSLQGGSRMARLRAAYRTGGPHRFYASVHWAQRVSAQAGALLRPQKRRASNR
jgi:hypothetical protein